MSARILEPTPENIGIAAAALRNSELVAMPTETVYGLAGNAFSDEALTRIYSSKERPTFDPLIVHIPEEWNSLERLSEQGLIDLSAFPSKTKDLTSLLIQRFWPGPLTLVLPKRPAISDLATSGLANVALRMPRHPVAQALLRAAQVPLAAPSANRFGRISPTRAQDVFDELGDRIKWILDGGPCFVGVESTVLAVSADATLTLLRPGGVTREELQKAVGPSVSFSLSTTPVSGPGQSPSQSPGMLASHYAPQKPLSLLPTALRQLSAQEFFLKESKVPGILLMTGDAAEETAWLEKLLHRPVVVHSLSSECDLAEIARNLFSGLRALDDSKAEHLFCEPCPSQEGLGFAITDRLKRAATRR